MERDATDRRRFATTRWSMVVSARQSGTAGRRALEALCEQYWSPVYVYFRSRGRDHEAARDLTQGLFLDLLSRGDLAKASPERGRFRTFLLTCAQHYAANEAARARALKRGGGEAPWSLDAMLDDGARTLELPDTEASPDRAFERRWALTLLSTVLDRLEGEYRARGRDAVFQHLRVYLEAGDAQPDYARLGERTGLTAGAVKVSVHRMRRRYRELLEEEIGQTLVDPGDAGAEVDVLLEALRGSGPRRGASGTSGASS